MSETQRRILIGVGSAVAAVAVVFLLIVVFNSMGATVPDDGTEGDSALGQVLPQQFTARGSLKEFAPIDDRKADAKPLTTQEVFAAKTVRAGKITLKRIGSQLDVDCSTAFWGPDLVAEVADSGCAQAVRGLFVSEDRGYVAQYTMLNLADVRAANALVESLKTLHRGGWVLPLQSDQAAFRGYTEASGQAMGHFVGLVWIGRADGGDPEERDDFVTLGLAAREVEKVVFRRVVSVAGLPPAETAKADPAPGTAPPSEPPPTQR